MSDTPTVEEALEWLDEYHEHDYEKDARLATLRTEFDRLTAIEEAAREMVSYNKSEADRYTNLRAALATTEGE